MSEIKNCGLDQYGTGPSNSSNLEQLALKGLMNLKIVQFIAFFVNGNGTVVRILLERLRLKLSSGDDRVQGVTQMILIISRPRSPYMLRSMPAVAYITVQICGEIMSPRHPKLHDAQ